MAATKESNQTQDKEDSTKCSSPEKSELPSVCCSLGSENANLSDEEVKAALHAFLDAVGPREDVLLLPPDFTRFHSQAGKLSRFICEYYNFVGGSGSGSDSGDGEKCGGDDVDGDENAAKRRKLEDTSGNRSQYSPDITILPALGTHFPMTKTQIATMFGDDLAAKEDDAFLVHDWRKDVETIGYAPASMVREATNGMVDRPWPAQLNSHVWSRRVSMHDPRKQPHKSLVLSIGQVVPHEVMGMANYNKNLFVGTGGVEAINLSHFIGAVHGMENMMGRASNPLRSILSKFYCAQCHAMQCYAILYPDHHGFPH